MLKEKNTSHKNNFLQQLLKGINEYYSCYLKNNHEFSHFKNQAFVSGDKTVTESIPSSIVASTNKHTLKNMLVRLLLDCL